MKHTLREGIPRSKSGRSKIEAFVQEAKTMILNLSTKIVMTNHNLQKDRKLKITRLSLNPNYKNQKNRSKASLHKSLSSSTLIECIRNLSRPLTRAFQGLIWNLKIVLFHRKKVLRTTFHLSKCLTKDSILLLTTRSLSNQCHRSVPSRGQWSSMIASNLLTRRPW